MGCRLARKVRHPIQDVVFAAVAHPVKAEEDSLAELRGLILKSHFQVPFHIVDEWLQRFLQ
jgi:hypothetical protein